MCYSMVNPVGQTVHRLPEISLAQMRPQPLGIVTLNPLNVIQTDDMKNE